MTVYGITETGFVLKRFENCKAEIEETFKETFGEDINLDASSVFGQLINILALREADLWEKMQASYDATKQDSASAIALDHILTLNGLSRLPATYSQVPAVLYYPSSTTVAAGFTIADLAATSSWVLQDEVVIDSSAVVDVLINITTVAAGSYTISLNGDDYALTVVGTETKTEILEGLRTLLLASVDATISAVVDAEVLYLTSLDLITTFSVTLAGNLAFTMLGTPGLFYNSVVGPTSAPANTLVNILTPATVSSVTNLVPASLGRLAETDVEARLRRTRSFAGINGATEIAIATRVLSEVENVSDCRVFSNNTPSTDDTGRPAHSIEVVVSGGTDDSVAQKIYDTVAAGIGLHGNTLVNLSDSLGQLREVRFSRPELVYAWVRYTLTYDTETVFSFGGFDEIRARLLAYAVDNIPLGRDLVNDRIKVPAIETSGVRHVTVELAITTTPGGSPSYAGTDIMIASTQLPVFDASRISFLEA